MVKLLMKKLWVEVWSLICLVIWDASELAGVDLGRFGPAIFAGLVKCSGVRKVEDDRK